MSEAGNKPPVHFWVIAGFALVWNLLGLAAFIGQVTMSPETIAAMPSNERELYENFPLWALLAFAIAVIGGTLGSALLLFRKRLAKPVFIASLAGIIAQMMYNVFFSKVLDVYGPGSLSMPVMILVFAVFLIWYSDNANKKGWLR